MVRFRRQANSGTHKQHAVQYTSEVENSLDDFTFAVCAAARTTLVWRADQARRMPARWTRTAPRVVIGA
jgi:hypothetical protein